MKESRRRSYLTLVLGGHTSHTSGDGSQSAPASHLHVPLFTLTAPDGETHTSSKKFHFGLRRHSNTTLNRTESMSSVCFRSLASYIEDGNLSGLQSQLSSHPHQVDERDENGATLLSLATLRGLIPHVDALLAAGADVNAADADGWTPLHIAAREGRKEVLATLINAGARLEMRDVAGWTALMWASYRGHTNSVDLLISSGADVNAHGHFHVSSLVWAAGRGHLEVVQLLLRHNAKVNVGDKYGTTALVWAARRGHLTITDSLLKSGANVDTAGMFSWTALLVATQGGYTDVVLRLLEQRPNVNAIDKDGCTALTIACKEGHYEISCALLAAGAYINIQDRAGDTNLIHAVKGGHRAIVETLLKRYADVDVCGKERKTAIYCAVEKGNTAIVRLLLAANPDLELATIDGDTPLLRAVRARHADIVQLLLDRRAKVTATDKRGDTALHIAMRARSKAIVEILLRNPKNSQLLYRPNKEGETAYNIDLNHQKQILSQVFGARRLNTNEDNENLLGYDLYSAALADMLSEPALSVPITVGLYAQWGSGKGFLLDKLRTEMQSFAHQWVAPNFRFSPLLAFAVLHLAFLVGTIIGVSLLHPIFGVIAGVSLFFLCYIILGVISCLHRHYDWDWPYTVTEYIAEKLNALRLILQVTFCHPPALDSGVDSVTAQPIRFYFTDQTRVSSSTGGENSVVQMLGSLYDAVESHYGATATRLYRALRPKVATGATSWRLRRVCCMPAAAVCEASFLCALAGAAGLALYISPSHQPSGLALHVLLAVVGLVLAVVAVANFYTWGRVFAALIFSQRTQLRRSIAKLDTLKSEGFQQALLQEVQLMKDMVRCLDSLSGQQTRLVVIVDGLDSCEQDKVLLVLDAVHMLFSAANSPFIVILAIDPHVITKAVEMNSRRLFNESNIGGHDYLRNLVHLPFFLQNSGLRKVRMAQQTSQVQYKRSAWPDTEEPMSTVLVRSLSNRRLSTESTLMSSSEKLKPSSAAARKPSRKLKLSESLASSLGSNLNVAVSGAHDLSKMLLTDDYFSDVNPRSMRRLMNVVYVTGRLLKAFHVDFNWYHLASWVNITEQWPYRTSWLVLWFEMHEDQLEDSAPLKLLYDKVRPRIPKSKEVEPLLELDRDEKKFDVFLAFHRSSLLVSDLKIFLPFTINLDPYIKKVIKEEFQQQQQQPQSQSAIIPIPAEDSQPPGVWNRRSKLQSRPSTLYNNSWNVQPWIFEQSVLPPPLAAVTQLSPDLADTRLSSLPVNGICALLDRIDDLNPRTLNRYVEAIKLNNINGRVLLHCDLDELKKVLNMSFGDWEMFRVLVVSLRQLELTVTYQQEEERPVSTNVRERKSSNPSDRDNKSVINESNKNRVTNKQSIMEKQVTLEDQMICGALQTLNEEACEDVLEDGGTTSGNIPHTTLIPPSPDLAIQQSEHPDETDFVILQAMPYRTHRQPVIAGGSAPPSSTSSGCSTPKAPRRPLPPTLEWNDVHNNYNHNNKNVTCTLLVELIAENKSGCVNNAPPTTLLDSDDESTPLVSDISTPSISLEPASPLAVVVKHYHNDVFHSRNSSPTQQFSSPEAEHKNTDDNNLTDSTDFSPISPIQELAGGETGFLTPISRDSSQGSLLSRQNALDREELELQPK